MEGNPYELDKQQRKTVKIDKKELKREAQLLSQAVGFKGEEKNRATEIMLLNSKATTTGANHTLGATQGGNLSGRSKRDKGQEELKSKVNKLFDMRASDPLIINRLKRNDSVFDKVTVNDNYFGGSKGQPHTIKEEAEEEDIPKLQTQESNLEDDEYFKNTKP